MLPSFINRATIFMQLALAAAIAGIVGFELIYSSEYTLLGRVAVLLLCGLIAIATLSRIGSSTSSAKTVHVVDDPISLVPPTFAKMTPILNALLQTMATQLEAISSHSSVLSSASDRLDLNGTEANVKSTIIHLLAENRIMKAASELANSELISKSIEIEFLRSDLEAAKHNADTDPLTQVANRRHILGALQAKIRSDETSVFCLAMLDIDNFKAINDTHGHQIGDIVLKTFAYEISRLLRGRDIVARYGGEEFLILLNNVTLPQAVAVIERLHTTLRMIDWTSIDGLSAIGTVTSSIGVAEWSHRHSIDNLIAQADSLLYKAKNEGRNRIVWS